MKTNSTWLHPREYVANNIEYRIASAGAIAKYKQSQAFVLSELAFNPFHKFSFVAKEILLLKYDIWFDFLCDVEQYFLVHPELNKDVIENIIEMSDSRERYYIETMRANKGTFKADYTDTWIEQHSKVYDLVKGKLRDMHITNPSSFYVAMSALFTEILTHTLYELQELDVIFYSDDIPVFNMDKTCFSYKQFTGHCLICERIEAYQKLRPFNDVIIKKYISDDIPFETTPTCEYLTEKGIKFNVI